MIDPTVIKIVLPWLTSFLLGFLITPIVLQNLIKYKCWKKKSGNEKGMGDDKGTPIFNQLHKEKEVNTPRMGGLVIVISVVITVVLYWLISFAASGGPSGQLDFLSRSQTWLPFAAFLAGAIVGFWDDLHQIKAFGRHAGGLPVWLRLGPTFLFALFAMYWFSFKLGYDSLHVPFYGDLFIGALFPVLFLFVFLAMFATSNIDGLDGLSGGIMAIIYAAYGFIAFFQEQFNLSAFCFVVVGGILVFLWYNIPPAKFYMTEAGYNALSFCLVIIAFLTDTVLLLPIIAIMLFVNGVTTAAQVLSKKFRGKKIFLVAPIHHHFEAIGWPAHQVVMRYWIVSIIGAVLGTVLAFTV